MSRLTRNGGPRCLQSIGYGLNMKYGGHTEAIAPEPLMLYLVVKFVPELDSDLVICESEEFFA